MLSSSQSLKFWYALAISLFNYDSASERRVVSFVYCARSLYSINTITTTTVMCIFDIIYHALCNFGLFRSVYVSLTLFILQHNNHQQQPAAAAKPSSSSMGKCVSKQTANSNWETGSADCVAVSERSFVLLIDDEVIIHKF